MKNWDHVQWWIVASMLNLMVLATEAMAYVLPEAKNVVFKSVHRVQALPFNITYLWLQNVP
jgi:hypothetical protein